MIKTTNELIEYLDQKGIRLDYTIISTFTHTILKCGTKADADILLDYFVSRPTEFYSYYFLDIFEKWGDLDYADKIYRTHFKDGKLINLDYPEILELLGNLRFEPIKPTLIHYGFNDDKGYYVNKSAILGLLNFNCSDIEKRIIKQIEETINQSQFSEFIPGLVCKVPNRTQLLKQLFTTGTEHCSSSFNSGIILGLSLCGKEGVKYFWNVIFNDFWEANGRGTGNSNFVYKGIINLNISLTDIYSKTRQNKNKLEQENGLKVLLALIEIRIRDEYSNSTLESFSEIYINLYAWENENKSNNITDLARGYELEEETYKLEGLLKLKMQEELIISL
ncbi:MAG: hypothetical protein ACI8ZM_001699 [Crocinitomix sp.]|jgi:hypothetical protein